MIVPPPSCPATRSAPGPAQTRSPPPPAKTWSFPVDVTITSPREVPVITSSPAVPVIVGAPQLGVPFGFLGLGAFFETVVAAVAELFAGVLSSGEATVAVLESVPAFFALTTMDTVGVAPLATVPSSQVTTFPAFVHVPADGVAET